MYGENRELHKYFGVLFIMGQPVHFKRVYRPLFIHKGIAYADKSIRIPCCLENPPCSFLFSPVQQLVALSVKAGLFSIVKISLGLVNRLDEAKLGETGKNIFIHTMAVHIKYIGIFINRQHEKIFSIFPAVESHN